MSGFENGHLLAGRNKWPLSAGGPSIIATFLLRYVEGFSWLRTATYLNLVLTIPLQVPAANLVVYTD